MYGTIGLTKIAAKELAANQALCALIPPLSCDPSYLYHHLDYVRSGWLKYSGQTTQPNINGATVRAHQVPVPAEKTQHTIARVLDTIDTAIYCTEAIIAKLKSVKQGLLQDLLTRGIDASGELRPPQSEASHFYKQTPLGWIPKEWECKKLGDITDSYAGGTPSRDMPGFFGGDIPWVKSTEVNRESIEATDERITEFGLRNSSAKWIPSGTPLVAMYGATAGVVSWLTIRATTNQAVLAAVPNGDQHGRWIYWVLTYSANRLLASVQGSGQPNLSKSTIDALRVAVPSNSEQVTIAKILDQHVARIALEVKHLAKLRAEKHGLMDDLLTGRVRVTPLLEQAAP
jgi:type I restriction enzyme S subunit